MSKTNKNLLIFLIIFFALILWWLYPSSNEVVSNGSAPKNRNSLPVSGIVEIEEPMDKQGSSSSQVPTNSDKEKIFFEASWGENSWGRAVEGEAYGPASFSVHENDVYVTDIHHGVISRQGLSGDRKVIFKSKGFLKSSLVVGDSIYVFVYEEKPTIYQLDLEGHEIDKTILSFSVSMSAPFLSYSKPYLYLGFDDVIYQMDQDKNFQIVPGLPFQDSDRFFRPILVRNGIFEGIIFDHFGEKMESFAIREKASSIEAYQVDEQNRLHVVLESDPFLEVNKGRPPYFILLTFDEEGQLIRRLESLIQEDFLVDRKVFFNKHGDFYQMVPKEHRPYIKKITAP